MSIIVQKFGGSSVADVHHIFNVAKKITDVYSKNNDVVVVVSAQGDTTDNLTETAFEINPNASKRETDMLLSAGEQMSAALLAMAVQSLGFPAVSLTGWQAGFKTNSVHTQAKIETVLTQRIQAELKKKNIVIIAGFQGVDEHGDITTLGRGGSDTSAVAVAAALKADACKIYTDVDGVYTADPRIVSSAKKAERVSYDEMLELSLNGAQVLSDKSIETAKKNGVSVEVLSSMLTNSKGTKVDETSAQIQNSVSGIAVKNNLVKVLISGIENRKEFAKELSEELTNSGIEFDKSLKPVGKNEPQNMFIFAVNKNDLKNAVKIIEKHTACQKDSQIFYHQNKSAVSVVKISSAININIASVVFETLGEIGISAEMVACNEKRVSVLIDSKNMYEAVRAIHTKLFEEDSLI